MSFPKKIKLQFLLVLFFSIAVKPTYAISPIAQTLVGYFGVIATTIFSIPGFFVSMRNERNNYPVSKYSFTKVFDANQNNYFAQPHESESLLAEAPAGSSPTFTRHCGATYSILVFSLVTYIVNFYSMIQGMGRDVA